MIETRLQRKRQPNDDNDKERETIHAKTFGSMA